MSRADHSRHDNRRFERQLRYLERRVPWTAPLVGALRARRGMIWRLPLGLLLIAGGFLAILPVFGLWMIPLGLLVLAIDLPALRGPVSAMIVRGRRRAEAWGRWWRRKWGR